MNRTTIAAVIAIFPLAAVAQQVPAIQANATATAIASGAASVPAMTTSTGGGAAAQPKPPAGWPPAVPLNQPPVSLDHKERTAATLAAQWRNRPDRPVRDADGVLRWVVGNSQARIVCAPLQMCDLELQPGEVVNNIRIGDTGFWTVNLANSGGAAGRTTHVTISPREAGRSTSMLVYTDQRTYAVKLASTVNDYTPRTGFVYPDTQQDGFPGYREAVAGGAMGGGVMSAGDVDPRNIEWMKISGDNPSWKPIAAYTDGRKTYLQFPKALAYGDSPSLVGVNDDGGLFSSPSERRVIYRSHGDKLIVDSVLPKMKLVLGVGSSQQQVTVERTR